MILRIQPLQQIDEPSIQSLTGPYTCAETYRVVHRDEGDVVLFELRLVPLEPPFVGRYDHFDAPTIERYQDLLAQGFSFGAWDGDQLVGMLIAEKYAWNNSLWVNEFHVAAARRGQGIGRQLMEAAVAKARAAGLRTVVCETQNQNTQAIHAYRKLGFVMEGIDISYYTNEDYPDRGIAVFMKRRIDEMPASGSRD